MIDIEPLVFDALAVEIELNHPGTIVLRDYQPTIATLPTVTIVEKSNTVNERMSTGAPHIENYSNLMYEVDIYTGGDRKSLEAKKIAETISKKFNELGMYRRYANPTPNYYNTQVYRYTMRFYCSVDGTGRIFRP